MKRLFLVAVFSAIFGAISAYLSAQISNCVHVDSEHPHDHWYDFCVISLTPGGIVDHLVYGNQGGFNLPYEESIEGDGLEDAILFNALAWTSIAFIFTGLIWSLNWSCRAILCVYRHAR